jgi:cyanophycinase
MSQTSSFKDRHRPILEDVAKRVGDGKLVIATLASEKPDEQWETYHRVFTELGVSRVEHLRADTREELIESSSVELLDDGAGAILCRRR